MADGKGPEPVPAQAYDEGYFLQECEGFDDFLAGGISLRLSAGLAAAEVKPGQKVLDIACGRGEAAYELARRGASVWGLDYAPAALRIAADQLAQRGSPSNVRFIASNARLLPFADGQFDVALMLDIVEHLHPWELQQALAEAHRVLRRGGRLIVHTAPNLWYYRFGYPVFRLTEQLRGRQLPADPKQRFRSHSLVHVNEQSPRSLRRALTSAGFRVKVWVDSERTAWERMGRFSRLAGRMACSLPLVKWVAAGDIYALACKD